MKTYLFTAITAISAAVVIGVIVIPLLKKLKMGQNILGYVKEHDYKSGTPTMGGIIFILAAIVAFFVFSFKSKRLSYVCLAIGLSYMIVGFIDDFIKIRFKRNEGLSPLQKIVFQFVIAVIAAAYSQKRGLTKVYIPFYGSMVDLKFWHFPLCVLVFLATTNSVNLTDGLDGLAGGVSYIYCAFMAVIIILEMKGNFANYVNADEYNNLVILLFALSGGLIGYLLFNTFKASVFMGDTGSLSLGGFIASISLLSGNLIYIPILGIMYALSSISVIVQVVHFKRTGKRVFLMSPLHHHFQHKGYAESKIVFGYKLITFLSGTLCLISCL